MSSLKWLTPNSAPSGTKVVRLVVPDQFELEAAIRGALVPLFYAESWELSGSVSVEDTLQYLEQSVYQTLVEWAECENGGSKMVGEVFAYAGTAVPEGCLLCDGSEYEQSAYPALYDAIGNTWGSASSGYFRVPLLSARTIVSVGQISGGTLREIGDIGGSESRNISENNLPEHDHTVAISSQNIKTQPVGTDTAVMRSGGSINTGNAGFGTALNIMPPYAVMPYYIVAE